MGWIRRAIRPWLLPHPPVGGSPLPWTDELWLVVERSTFVLGAIASLTAIFGIWSWYTEADERHIERASKIYEATAGALTTIDQSRTRFAEVGQSEAVGMLYRLHRPLQTVDLNDVAITGQTLPSPLLQPPGSLLILNGTSVTRGSDEEIPNAEACRRKRLISADWIVFTQADLGSTPVCILGSLIADQMRASRLDIKQTGFSVLNSEVRSRHILSAVTELPPSSDAKTKRPAPNVYLASTMSVLRSKMPDLTVSSFADSLNVEYSSLPRAKLAMDGAASIRIVGTDFRSSILTSNELDQLQAKEKCRAQKDEARSIAITQSPLRSSVERMEAELSDIKTKLRASRSPSPALPKRLAALERSISLLTSQLDANDFQLWTLECKFRLAYRDWDSDLIGLPPSGVHISYSDIRGADLSKIPADLLVLADVCADATTKLPAGVKVNRCADIAARYWDRLEGCSKWSGAGDTPECHLAKRRSEGWPDIIPLAPDNNSNDLVSRYNDILRRSERGVDQLPRSPNGTRSWVYGIVSAVDTRSRVPGGGGNYNR